MRTVLYAYDLEPITVIELGLETYKFLEKHRVVQLAVTPVVPVTQGEFLNAHCKIVTIHAERFRFRDIETIMLFTYDEESAMLLKASFLPGQLRTVQDSQRAAFAQGFLTALNKLG